MTRWGMVVLAVLATGCTVVEAEDDGATSGDPATTSGGTGGSSMVGAGGAGGAGATTTTTSTGAGGGGAGSSTAMVSVTDVTYPFLIGFSGDLFPTYMAHLLGSVTPHHDTTSLACFQLDNQGDVPVAVRLTVNLPGYATESSQVRSIAPGSSTECMHPTPDLAALYANTATVNGQIATEAEIVADGTTIHETSHPVEILPGDQVRWTVDPFENYVATTVMPDTPAVINLLNPLTQYSRWGTFGVGGYDMHVGAYMDAVSTSVSAGSYVSDLSYFEAGESVTVAATSVSGGIDDELGFYVMNETQYGQYTSDPCAGTPVELASPDTGSGANISFTASTAGYYYLVWANSCGNISSRSLTFQRTGTGADTVWDVLQASYLYLRDQGLVYTNVAATYFDNGIGKLRWPSQSLTSNSANCADGTVLFASIAERLELEPVLVHVTDPNYAHMFIGIRASEGDPLIWPLETTLVGTSSSFFDALTSGIQQVNQYQQSLFLIDVKDARQDGILPIPQ